MQVHKVVLTIVDLDELGADEIVSVIENTRYPNWCISPHVVSVETADVGEWSDDHLLNNKKTASAEWERLFPSLRNDRVTVVVAKEAVANPGTPFEDVYLYNVYGEGEW